VKKKKIIASWVMLIMFALVGSGCALIGPAVSAGISYAIYKATK
jgi:hypothetical protein